MARDTRYESQRDRSEDRGNDYSGQQGGSYRASGQGGYRSSQMDQYEDTGSRSQTGWSTGEDYPSRAQMGGASEAGSRRGDYGRSEVSRYQDRDEDAHRYGQGQYGYSQSGGQSGRYSQGSDYDESPYRSGASSSHGGMYGQDRSMQSSSYRASSAGREYPSGYSGDYRASAGQWSHNAYDGRNVSHPYGANYMRDGARDDFGSWREYGESRGFFAKAGDEIASWFGDEDAARRREQDHRGRGPSNYTRSDERIQEDANEQLTRDWRVDASNITVKVEGGEVTLEGHVPSRDAKRRAEDCVEDVSGVKHVQNNLRVHNVQAHETDSAYGQSSFGASSGSTSHNLTSTGTSKGTGNATTGVGTTAPGATGSTGSTGAGNKT